MYFKWTIHNIATGRSVQTMSNLREEMNARQKSYSQGIVNSLKVENERFKSELESLYESYIIKPGFRKEAHGNKNYPYKY